MSKQRTLSTRTKGAASTSGKGRSRGAGHYIACGRRTARRKVRNIERELELTKSSENAARLQAILATWRARSS